MQNHRTLVSSMETNKKIHFLKKLWIQNFSGQNILSLGEWYPLLASALSIQWANVTWIDLAYSHHTQELLQTLFFQLESEFTMYNQGREDIKEKSQSIFQNPQKRKTFEKMGIKTRQDMAEALESRFKVAQEVLQSSEKIFSQVVNNDFTLLYWDSTCLHQFKSYSFDHVISAFLLDNLQEKQVKATLEEALDKSIQSVCIIGYAGFVLNSRSLQKICKKLEITRYNSWIYQWVSLRKK